MIKSARQQLDEMWDAKESESSDLIFIPVEYGIDAKEAVEKLYSTIITDMNGIDTEIFFEGTND